jgi:sensor domain CHASE-containing protein
MRFACLVLMILAIGTSVAFFASAQDEQQIVSEQKIVASAINDAMTKLGDALRPNAYWDDAYNHLTDKVDANWSEKNLGPYARDTSGISVVLIVSERGNAFYRFVGNELGKIATDYENDAAVKQLVSQARAATTAPPAISTGFVRVGDRIYLGAASQIVPNDNRAKRPLERHNVEVYLQAFGAARISKVQRDFQLSRVSLSVDPPPSGMASVNLHDASGANVGYLWWHAATPGRTFALSVAPFALFIVAVIGLLLWLVLRSWAFTLMHLEKTEGRG